MWAPGRDFDDASEDLREYTFVNSSNKSLEQNHLRVAVEPLGKVLPQCRCIIRAYHYQSHHCPNGDTVIRRESVEKACKYAN